MKTWEHNLKEKAERGKRDIDSRQDYPVHRKTKQWARDYYPERGAKTYTEMNHGRIDI